MKKRLAPKSIHFNFNLLQKSFLHIKYLLLEYCVYYTENLAPIIVKI